MLDLFYNSLRGTAQYVSNHIHSDRHRKAYVEQATELLQPEYKSLEDAEWYINGEKEFIINQKESFWTKDIREFLYSSKKYKLMACDHALDIARSLHGRFITGKEGDKFIYKGISIH